MVECSIDVVIGEGSKVYFIPAVGEMNSVLLAVPSLLSTIYSIQFIIFSTLIISYAYQRLGRKKTSPDINPPTKTKKTKLK